MSINVLCILVVIYTVCMCQILSTCTLFSREYDASVCHVYWILMSSLWDFCCGHLLSKNVVRNSPLAPWGHHFLPLDGISYDAIVQAHFRDEGYQLSVGCNLRL